MIWAQEPDGATRDQPKRGEHAAMLKTQNDVRCSGQNGPCKPVRLHLTLTTHLRRMSEGISVAIVIQIGEGLQLWKFKCD